MSGENVKKAYKMKIKTGDKVKVIAGKDKGREGRVLVCDRKNNRVVVEGVNMVSKHVKAGRRRNAQQGGIIRKEASIHASNVMYVYKGKPVRLGHQVSVTEREGGKTLTKQRVARPSGEVIE